MFDTEGILVIFLDVTCVALAGLPFVLLTLQHNPIKRGFFCNDDTIKYPFKEDTISCQLLCGVMIPLTLSVVIFGECLPIYKILRSPFSKRYISPVYKAVGSFLFGAAVSQSLTDITKYSTGRLRPYFLDVCKPNWRQIDCSTNGYIENITCTGDQTMINEGRLSFYSGHASFSMYCMLFLALYLQARLQTGWARLLRPTIQFLLITTSLYVGLSRVSDYKHHWSDVLVGLIQGSVVAILTVFFVSNFFETPVGEDSEEEMSHANLQDGSALTNNYGSTSGAK
ncbi:phospholipid phosphatase 1 [Chanos chanos]|uniref:Phospholipid phosphatase 1 n=1 Tax=Chanos chanos TaxID=29144 RepID=A0A6J2VU37_CHACN|nr:phospholipid phosphatase 1-like [Chanos chanos]